MKCPKCKADNPEDSQFCRKCATALTKIPATLTSPPPEKSALDFAPGQYFGKRYQIIEEIGRGGMGRVYKAVDKELNKVVALKMIKPELSDTPAMVKRFKKELLLAREVTHKNVCRIHDLGEVKGIKFISMQYIKGQDLKDFIKQSGKLTTEKAIDITKQICEALQAAHDEGVIHRDLKPQNIMLDKEGNSYVMDFGIARSLEAEEVTKPGVIIGTPHYMSPEQGEGKGADTRSDIYSLGCILYEMITGKPPFEAETSAALIHKHLKETPKLPSKLNPQISPALETVILKCIKKNPKKRYQRADKIIKAISEAKAGLVSAAKPAKVRKESIAVLPFINLSPQKEQEYFCDGLAEELINLLTKIKDLRVVARTSAFSFKGKEMDIREIGKKLSVDKILEGSVRKAGNRLRITAELINVDDGYHLWSERYDREMDDVFAIQDEISMEIVNALKIKLEVEEKVMLAKRYTQDLEAYNFYLKGRYYWIKRTEKGFQKSLECFQQAIGKDPMYALAYAGMADSYNLLGWYDYLPPKETFPRAKAAAEKALEMDDTLAEAHASLAFAKFLYDWEWSAAEQEFKRALELNIAYPTAHHWYAEYLALMGRLDEAIAKAKRAQELDPLSLIMNTIVGWALYYARQYDRAIEEYRKIIEMDPNFIATRYMLSLVYAQKKMYKEAVAEAQKAIDLSGGSDSPFIPTLGLMYSLSGKRDKAKKVLDQLHELLKQRYVSPAQIALIYGGLGQKDQAFEWLEKAYEERDHWLILLKIDPLFDSLRSDPRFKALLKKMNLE